MRGVIVVRKKKIQVSSFLSLLGFQKPLLASSSCLLEATVASTVDGGRGHEDLGDGTGVGCGSRLGGYWYGAHGQRHVWGGLK